MQPAAELQATAGLYSHELDITGVKVDGEDANFELLSHEQQDTGTGKWLLSEQHLFLRVVQPSILAQDSLSLSEAFTLVELWYGLQNC